MKIFYTLPPQWRVDLIARWDNLRASTSDLPGFDPSIDIARFAKYVGVRWYASRDREPLSKFLSLTGEELLQVPAFGRRKAECLCNLVEAVLSLEFPVNSDGVQEGGITLVEHDPYDALEHGECPELCL